MPQRVRSERIAGSLPQETAPAAEACESVDASGVTAQSPDDPYPEILEIRLTPCGARAIATIHFSCPNGHGGPHLVCERHARPGRNQLCGHCQTELRLLVPATITVTPL